MEAMHRGPALALTLALVTVAPLAAQSGAPGKDSSSAPPPGTQFVYINSQQLLQATPGAGKAQQQWNQELGTYRSEVQSLAAQVDSLEQAYQRQEAMLSDAAKTRKQQEIQQKRQQLQQRTQQLEQQASQRQQELLQPILNKVRGVIEQIRKERGYTMVFDAAGSGLLAADPKLDITNMVIQRLKASGDSAAGDSAASGGSGGR
ncbi:MAG: OmpH family outer membrane protein [Candidatus Palauibacterales bacterium]|nr:OmpH family outer membrane protein [Candidatus Palauibacterales bacterium]MDP2583180.1 OmpH family outer membrane protein [Candidatus Palauibacterales bacterium]